MRGHKDWNHDNDQWIGIYRTISVLKDEYLRAKHNLEEEPSSDDTAWGGGYSDPGERVMIHAFNEVEGKWYYDIKPESLFDSKPTDFKEIEVMLDSEIMYQWRMFFTKKGFSGYRYENHILGDGQNEEESIIVKFDVKNSYEVLDCFQGYFGDFNLCPSTDIMRKKAKEWQEKFAAELTGISHDGLRFKCRRKLTGEGADEIMTQAALLHADITDCKREKVKDHIISNGVFTL